MGITKKLGELGIPGFRSGKWWKMLLAFCGYWFIFMIIMVFVLGFGTQSNTVQKDYGYQTPNSVIDTVYKIEKYGSNIGIYLTNDRTKLYVLRVPEEGGKINEDILEVLQDSYRNKKQIEIFYWGGDTIAGVRYV